MEEHECELKRGPMWCTTFDKEGNIFCKSCSKKLERREVEKSCLEIMDRRLKGKK